MCFADKTVNIQNVVVSLSDPGRTSGERHGKNGNSNVRDFFSKHVANHAHQ